MPPLSFNSLVQPTDGNCVSVVAALNLVSIKEFPHTANWLSAFMLLDSPSASAAKVANYATMTVVYLIAVLVEPVNYQARDSPLLGTCFRVRAIHGGSPLHALTQIIRNRPLSITRTLYDQVAPSVAIGPTCYESGEF